MKVEKKYILIFIVYVTIIVGADGVNKFIRIIIMF